MALLLGSPEPRPCVPTLKPTQDCGKVPWEGPGPAPPMPPALAGAEDSTAPGGGGHTPGTATRVLLGTRSCGACWQGGRRVTSMGRVTRGASVCPAMKWVLSLTSPSYRETDDVLSPQPSAPSLCPDQPEGEGVDTSSQGETPPPPSVPSTLGSWSQPLPAAPRRPLPVWVHWALITPITQFLGPPGCFKAPLVPAGWGPPAPRWAPAYRPRGRPSPGPSPGLGAEGWRVSQGDA